jgi:hypothetical protein
LDYRSRQAGSAGARKPDRRLSAFEGRGEDYRAVITLPELAVLAVPFPGGPPIGNDHAGFSCIERRTRFVLCGGR